MIGTKKSHAGFDWLGRNAPKLSRHDIEDPADGTLGDWLLRQDRGDLFPYYSLVQPAQYCYQTIKLCL